MFYNLSTLRTQLLTTDGALARSCLPRTRRSGARPPPSRPSRLPPSRSCSVLHTDALPLCFNLGLFVASMAMLGRVHWSHRRLCRCPFAAAFAAAALAPLVPSARALAATATFGYTRARVSQCPPRRMLLSSAPFRCAPWCIGWVSPSFSGRAGCASRKAAPRRSTLVLAGVGHRVCDDAHVSVLHWTGGLC